MPLPAGTRQVLLKSRGIKITCFNFFFHDILESEIQNMMHGFGDSPHPLVETAEFIERVVKEQLLQILECLTEVADIRESNSIGMEEFLFLLRHNSVKLRRFCHYLHVRDMKKNLMESNTDDPHGLDFVPVGDPAPKISSKNLTNALRFLHHIDPSGFLSRVADPNRETILKDENFRERMDRIEHMTLSMDVQQYLEFSKVTFSFLRYKYDFFILIYLSGKAMFIWKTPSNNKIPRLAFKKCNTSKHHN